MHWYMIVHLLRDAPRLLQMIDGEEQSMFLACAIGVPLLAAYFEFAARYDEWKMKRNG